MQTNSKMVVFPSSSCFLWVLKGRETLVFFSTGRKTASKPYLKYVWFCEIPLCHFLSASVLDILPKLFHPQKQAGPSMPPFRAYRVNSITRCAAIRDHLSLENGRRTRSLNQWRLKLCVGSTLFKPELGF